ncbi:hypothetical protein AUEXF2481DRAFT_1909 [Aureobasidium subglaciale EXF-2481]|uniref:CAP-Gly domain-containing protein n=1 Tax=Aureobasidium subglaciale (strain EXF-2481) TaxID=1043005 RepID=A0A074ZKX8_AURSE|nr:uncharacterized protein AUEXF2481DRAFT_1909 [Aureobasidium subglaciale EXF-2481]KAI5205567.1 hypothetical protein E4T38_04288 [Aureobasidium subglaciale]KAI5224516.1 hypothetical protein E4T40_03900 [Aureobasidium subglaciale]KAI5227728.1 hypothetical protein E4T41_04120 [Aureobasidium subglaciale]KAI5263291.1 hypothetical protein E4T46_03741 [Aureobasidium subglaciale]KEQ99091.1 hypothetical protein AUEXF2481DRAFT_1909 [Aureobasidium subglaciale EXF-2481]
MSTPRQRVRPSNSPMHTTDAQRKAREASLNALTGNAPRSPGPTSNMADSSVALGDMVNVPGDMYGTVKFVGPVRGKQGKFIGVELASEFAARGKNDGDVDGIRYFDTDMPGAGIFLPVHRAEKRQSPSRPRPPYPGTPTTPSHYRLDSYTPPTAAMPNFSQSMGPGARPPSPLSKLKSRRPSLPRPESPFRKQPNLVPTPARNFSMSQRSAVPPRFTSSPAPPLLTTPRAASRSAAPSRPYSRTGSRVGNRGDSQRPSTSSAASIARRSPSRQVAVDQDGEIQRLLAQIEEKDRQLQEQAGSLVEMEASLKEIQDLIPADGLDADESSDVYELRQAIHDRDDKIQSLIDEFDAHRADFRSTIDTLELASAETERVYEAKIADLLAEIHELRELGHSREDVENVARQLKGLEELVAELEEGLEDARRGEAEARGEVEFLRGEVERGRSELRREREKAARALQGAKDAEGQNPRDKDVELKDDEIRGLKAIIHSLSSGPEASPMARQSPAPGRFADPEELKNTQATVQQLEREKSELQGLIDRKAFREEELERAVDQLRRAAEQERDSIINTEAAAEEVPRHHLSRSPENVRSPTRYRSPRKDEQRLWCDSCDSPGHDTRTCPDAEGVDNHESNGGHEGQPKHDEPEPEHELSQSMQGLNVSAPSRDRYNDKLEAPAPLSLRKTLSNNSNNNVAENTKDSKDTSEMDNDKWCALCEKDGHLAFDCPDEQY